jgi:hypothetical protein
VGWEIGYFFWGWVGDWYVTSVSKAKRVFTLLGLMALVSLLIPLTKSAGLVLALFFWATFVADGFVVLSLKVGSLIYPKEQTAMVAGIGSGAWSLVLVPILPLYGRWLDLRWYSAIFVSMSLLPIVGVALWMWLSKPWREA